jgi:hypothetical protein
MRGKFFLLGPLVIEMVGGKIFLPLISFHFLIALRSTALDTSQSFFPKDNKIFHFSYVLFFNFFILLYFTYVRYYLGILYITIFLDNG